MSNYVGLACRNYGKGKIVLFSDHLSAQTSYHKICDLNFRKSFFDYVSKGKKIGVFNIKGMNFADGVSDIKDFEFKEIYDFEEINNYDALYVIGSEGNSVEEMDLVERYVKNGGGLIIEGPEGDGGFLKILYGIDSAIVLSGSDMDDFAAWNQSHSSHPLFNDSSRINFISLIDFDSLGSEWTVLASSGDNDKLADA